MVLMHIFLVYALARFSSCKTVSSIMFEINSELVLAFFYWLLQYMASILLQLLSSFSQDASCIFHSNSNYIFCGVKLMILKCSIFALQDACRVLHISNLLWETRFSLSLHSQSLSSYLFRYLNKLVILHSSR